ncbi:ubiquitin-protein transferase activating protein, partial [Cladochytrium tenue]
MPPSSSVSIPGSRAPALTVDALGGVPARDGVRRLASTVATGPYTHRLAASPLRGPEAAKTLVTALLNSPKPLRAAALLSAATAIGLRDAVDHPQGELGKAEALASPSRSLHPRNAAYGRSSPSTPVRFLAASPRRPPARSPLALSRAAGAGICPSPSRPSSPRLASVAPLGRASGGIAAGASFADAFLPPRASPARRPAAAAATSTRIGSPRRPYSPCGIGQRSPARILARVVGAQSPAVTSRARAGLGTNIGVGGEKYESVLNTPRRGATKSLRSTAVYDRFIPTQSSMDLPSSHYLLSSENYTSKSDEYHIPSASGPPPKMLDADALAQQEELARACGINLSKRILAFKLEPPVSHHGDPLHSLWKNAARNKKAMPASQRRRISTIPERCLDAPGLVDDYYLNLLDWSSTNLLAVGLEDMVYVWNAATGEVSEFCSAAPGGGAAEAGAETPAGSVCSVRWSADGSHLAVGTGAGDTVIYDGETGAVVRSMGGHAARVGAVAWDRHLVSSGCRDGSIWHHDVRVARHKVSELAGHSAEVCGLRWRADGAMLASGGNDNLVNIWDARSSVPKFTKGNHTAAVK